MSARNIQLLARLSIVACATAAIASGPAGAAGKPDFDIRGPRETTLAAPPAKMPPGQQRALDDFRRGGAAEIRWSRLTGAPSRIQMRGKPLTPASAASPQAIASSFLARNRELLGLTPEDLRDLRTSRDFGTKHNGNHHLTLQQRAEGRDVFGGRIRMSLDAQGRVLILSGEPIPNALGKVNALEPALGERDAVHQAALEAGIANPGKSEAIDLVYFPLDGQTLRLAWHVYVEDADSPDGYDTLVDAIDGTVLWRKNRTLYSHVTAHGQVFTSDSPLPNTPAGTQYSDTREDVPFHGGASFPHGDPHYDWWNGVTPTTTTGNNVDAYLDTEDPDGPDTACESCGDEIARPDNGPDFLSSLDLSLDPDQYQDAAIINLFYWNNRLHDFFYRLGFDEAAGNFQDDNFGLGGDDGDRVHAEAQDASKNSDPGNCNANMNTPPDGDSPRMQMYLCDNTSPKRDGDLEAVVIGHEYSHGVHTRLVPLSGRQNPQEGISDYFGLSLVAESADPYGGAYGVGDYLFGYNSGNGIRSSPYSTDSAIFPRTYADINDASVCNLGTCSVTTATNCNSSDDCPSGESCQKAACFFDDDCDSPPMDIDRRPCTVSVHHTGELWANALWIGRMNLIEKHGFANGARTMNRLVIEGMKLSPDNPSMLDGRDMILAADETTNGGVNVCLLWDAFARMGMGFSALTTSNDDLNPLEAFDVPSECTPVMEVNALDDFGGVCIGEFEANTLTVYNTGAGELIVSSVTRTAGSTDITVDPLPSTPVVVASGSHIDFTVRCTPTSSGAKTATISIETNDPAQPTLDLEYACTGGQPDVATTFTGAFGEVCLGTTKDLDLTIHNAGSCPLTVTGVVSTVPDIQPGPVGGYPLVIDGGDSVLVPIRYQPTIDVGAVTGNLTVASNDPDDAAHPVSISGNAPPALIETFIGNAGSFGNVCVEALFKELPLTIQNNGLCPLDIDSVTVTGGDAAHFTLPTPTPTPTLEPLNSVVIPVRFTPGDFTVLNRASTVRVASRTLHAASALADDDTAVSGSVPPPDINVPAAGTTQEFGNVCAGETATMEIPVCNTGACNLDVTSATINCDDFTIVGQPFPSVVSPDFCIPLTVQYTPTEEGTHTCQLTITSNDPDENPVLVTLTGTTPGTNIDVPESLTFLPEVVSSVDVCESKQPLPISNNGLCPLEIESISVFTNPDEFALEGVPSFPILLQSGHIAGEGDLRAIFAPDEPLEGDRSKSGVIRTTYVSDQVTGATTDYDTEVCGEGVLTGARVLVTYGGSPVDTVDRIQLQRVVGNRNRRPQLDSIGVVQNVSLQSIDPSDPICADFQFHQEYGGVSNPIQLLPGFYQVTATIKVGNRKRTKTVGFSVNSCDFNPSVIVTF